VTPRTAVVCVKSVPVGGAHLRIDGRGLSRAGLRHGLDPVNEVAVAWAAQARDHGLLERVIAVSMGPASAAEALRRALAMGCDDAVLVTDARLEDADVRRTASTLAAAIQQLGGTIAVFGYESADGSSGTVPAAVAAHLDRPLLSFARAATLAGDVLRVEHDLGAELEVAECSLPLVLTLATGVVEPRFPTLKDTLSARKRAIATLDLDALGAGAAAQPTRERVVDLVECERDPRATMVVDGSDGPAAIERVLVTAGVLDG
jgi:electron transfer flavoprotein beta subunit